MTRSDTRHKSNKANVKSLKLAYAVALGGTSANENPQSTPLAENGYVVDESMQELWKFNLGSGIMRRR
jgi:hypothetical protein